MTRLKDLTGMKFGRLSVIKRTDDKISKSGKRYAQWLCRCDCGNEVVVLGTNLKSNRTVSCGCYNNEQRIKRSKKYNKYNLSGEYGIGYTSKGEEFWFDLDDYEKIKDRCWNIDNCGYVTTNASKNDVDIPSAFQMQRLIMDFPDGLYVDHINHNKTDNRKSNLRIVTNQQNAMNHVVRSGNRYGETGINFLNDRNKWRANITVNYKNISLGTFDTKEEAVLARKDAEERYFGEYSYDNSMSVCFGG